MASSKSTTPTVCPHCGGAVDWVTVREGCVADITCLACNGEWRVVKTQPWREWEIAFRLRWWRDHPQGHLTFEENGEFVMNRLRAQWEEERQTTLYQLPLIFSGDTDNYEEVSHAK